MLVPLYVTWCIAFVLGLVASGVTQFGAAKTRAEAKAKTKNLQTSLDRLIERNADRRNRLKRRQEILDGYRAKHIEPPAGQFNADALEISICLEVSRIEELEKSVLAAESVVTNSQANFRAPDMGGEFRRGFRSWLRWQMGVRAA